MTKIASAILLLFVAAYPGLAEETSFRTVKLPDAKGHQKKAVLTFSDNDKAVEVRPARGETVTVPYGQIDKASYEFRSELTMGVSKSHWLQIAYHDQDAHKVLVLRMDKHDYTRVLDALKAHTGIDAEVLGNADKRLK